MVEFKFSNFSINRGAHSIDQKNENQNFFKVFSHVKRVRLCVIRLCMFYIEKPFLLKHLVGERYKGWISRPPLSVHSSVKYILCLCLKLSIPCREYLFHGPTRMNYLVYSGLIKHLVELCIPCEGCFVSWYYKINLLRG